MKPFNLVLSTVKDDPRILENLKFREVEASRIVVSNSTTATALSANVILLNHVSALSMISVDALTKLLAKDGTVTIKNGHLKFVKELSPIDRALEMVCNKFLRVNNSEGVI